MSIVLDRWYRLANLTKSICIRRIQEGKSPHRKSIDNKSATRASALTDMFNFADLILVFHPAWSFVFILTSVLEQLLIWVKCLERDVRIKAIFSSRAIIEDKSWAANRHSLFVVIKATKFAFKMVLRHYVAQITQTRLLLLLCYHHLILLLRILSRIEHQYAWLNLWLSLYCLSRWIICQDFLHFGFCLKIIKIDSFQAFAFMWAWKMIKHMILPLGNLSSTFSD